MNRKHFCYGCNNYAIKKGGWGCELNQENICWNGNSRYIKKRPHDPRIKTDKEIIESLKNGGLERHIKQLEREYERKNAKRNK